MKHRLNTDFFNPCFIVVFSVTTHFIREGKVTERRQTFEGKEERRKSSDFRYTVKQISDPASWFERGDFALPHKNVFTCTRRGFIR